ncbi:D-2-hydroxyacid dehydrogenase [Salirhabdus salicampi]|uniref:D-2-hydroxyacid dehydrogenase n=1 Tax=Salirhabdus salicampi TaxID=476102 RepID=UPI0020C248B0|nr:D-2-hydroxyacid dehydrogenase [Salirhabdus salicampi]MCP8617987.1 D-2-hydroxyacid dehydrogenase [Salirhabdus salicampi]
MLVLTSCKVKSKIREHVTKSYPNIRFQFCPNIDEAESYLPEAEVLITYGEDLTNKHIEQAKQLKWIMVISAGLDQMPFEAIEEKGILVTNARGIHSIPMAEYAIAMLLQVCRQSKQLIAHEQQHIWDRKVQMTEISGKTMLVLGTGAIGQEAARLGKAFRMKTIGISKSGKRTPHFDEVGTSKDILSYLPEADFVIGVLPSTPETYKWIGKEHFETMKEDAVFLNMGRGTTVDEEALLQALQQKKIHHAVLDVFEQEPLDGDHPFWDMDNVTVTPHLSGISPQYQPRAFDIFKDNLNTYIKGETDFINIVDPKRGY